MRAVIAVTTALCSFAAVRAAWDVASLYGARPSLVRLSDVAVWRNRAYASWPRLDASQPVTLLELPWPEADDRPAAARWMPRRPFCADQQKLDDCRSVQSAVALDLDKLRGHLYVLDNGHVNCQPKIVIYDLKTYRCIQSTELDGLDGSELSGLAVDSRPFKSETRVYAGSARGGHLTVFDPGRCVWYRVALERDPRDRPAATAATAVQDPWENGVPAECIAVSRLQSSVFLTSSRSHDLYSASFRDLRNLTSHVNTGVLRQNGDVLVNGLQVRWEGVKLGNSSGLYADIRGGLNYVYTRDFVAVRSSPGAGGVHTVAAEDHKILLQSQDLLPAVTKIFTDNVNYLQIWALNAVPNSENRHTVKINTLPRFKYYST